ncbi:MAG: transcription termination factor NusA [Nitrospirae bacterium]|nr:transcription termination factor NusA [Nitrospirota bacterium]
MEIRLKQVIDEVSREKGIDQALIRELVISAVDEAARKKFGPQAEFRTNYEPETDTVELVEYKKVVEKAATSGEISVGEACKKAGVEDITIGDLFAERFGMEELDRVFARNVLQIITKKLKEIERANVYNEFKDRKGQVVVGIVRRFERGDIVVDIGRAEAIFPEREQIPKERYRIGNTVRCYILDVTNHFHGPQLILSRRAPGFIMKLFESEVPEVAEGLVQIVAVAREAGWRAKVSVRSKDPRIDPVGAFIGSKGSRVQAIVQDLSGEKIDIVPYSDDPIAYVCNALAPAKIQRVILDEEAHQMEIIVGDDHLSVAIGKRGQNVRLAVELTGWNLDIRSESEVRKLKDQVKKALMQVEAIDDHLAEELYKRGVYSIEEISRMEPAALGDTLGVEPAVAERIRNGAAGVLESMRPRRTE